ncbi:hypothetical protein MMPV_008934 [Pyropia vietnamensis]
MDGSCCVRPHLDSINDTLESIFDGADSRLHPHAVGSLHAVALRRPTHDPSPCNAAEAFSAAAKPAGVATFVPSPENDWGHSLEALRKWAAAAGLGVDVVTVTATSVLVNRDARRGLRVVLFRAPNCGGYSPAVAIRGDRVADLHDAPLHRVSSTRTVVDSSSVMTGEHVQEDKLVSHWTHMFLTVDVEPIAATPWLSWPFLMKSLVSVFDAPPAAPACDWPMGVPKDGRLAELASWADYHRTSVRVRYNRDDGRSFHFRILPRLCATAHSGARIGRAVCVEVGSEGGRLWHSPVGAMGRRQFTEVYVENERSDDGLRMK